VYQIASSLVTAMRRGPRVGVRQGKLFDLNRRWIDARDLVCSELCEEQNALASLRRTRNRSGPATALYEFAAAPTAMLKADVIASRVVN